jgi:pimeloyl-ACP methyl ester carboxylesterase
VLGGLELPVTLIAAELDQVSSTSAMTALSDRLPTSRLHVLQGAGHLRPFSDPDVLAELLLGRERQLAR